MNRVTTAIALIATLAVALPAGAQGRGKGKGNKGGNSGHVPPGQLPPAGMCRIWIDGVPPGQQPAPTDCSTAVRNRPANGRVIFGDEHAKPGSANKYKKNRGYDDRYDRRDRDDDYDRERRRSDDNTCVDSNRDGRCDWTQRSGDTRDGSTSGSKDGGWLWDRVPRGGTSGSTSGSTSSRSGTMSGPEMISAVVFGRGQRTADVQRWVGTDRVAAQLFDGNRDGRPERVNWTDASGQLRQVWVDSNHDGRADRVDVYQNGKRVRTIYP